MIDVDLDDFEVGNKVVNVVIAVSGQVVQDFWDVTNVDINFIAAAETKLVGKRGMPSKKWVLLLKDYLDILELAVWRGIQNPVSFDWCHGGPDHSGEKGATEASRCQ